MRFVLIGIGFAIALRSVTTLFLTKGDYLVAQQAQIWMTGSLNRARLPEAAPIGWTLLLLLPAVVWAARAQRTVSMDDDTATALGVRRGAYGSGSSPSAWSWPPWRRARPARWTSWRCWPRRSPGAPPGPRIYPCCPRRCWAR
ncbi:hypothetical protein SCALM49S_04434 [Streptomyces californicus]